MRLLAILLAVWSHAAGPWHLNKFEPERGGRKVVRIGCGRAGRVPRQACRYDLSPRNFT